jgi:fucose permease
MYLYHDRYCKKNRIRLKFCKLGNKRAICLFQDRLNLTQTSNFHSLFHSNSTVYVSLLSPRISLIIYENLSFIILFFLYMLFNSHCYPCAFIIHQHRLTKKENTDSVVLNMLYTIEYMFCVVCFVSYIISVARRHDRQNRETFKKKKRRTHHAHIQAYKEEDCVNKRK